MHRTSIALALSLLVTACGKKPADAPVPEAKAPAAVAQPPIQAMPKDPLPPPASPINPPEVREYAKAARAFTTEAKSMGKLLELKPSPEDFRAKNRTLTDLFTRMPDPPAGHDLATSVHKSCRESLETLRTIDSAIGLGAWNSLNFNAATASFKKPLVGVDELLAELEK